MHIGLNLTRSFLKYAYVLIQSILENNRDSHVTVHIFSGNIEEGDLGDVQCMASAMGGDIHLIRVEESLIKTIIRNPLPEHPLYMHTFYFMFDFLPEGVDRLLMMDGDMVVKKSLRTFYDRNFSGNYAICGNGDCIWEEENDWKDGFQKFHVPLFSTIIVLFDVTAIRRDFTLKDIARADTKVNAVLGRSNEEFGFAVLFQGKVQYVSEQKYGLYLLPGNIGRFGDKTAGEMQAIVEDAVAIHYHRAPPWARLDGYLQRYWWAVAERSPYYAEFYADAYRGLKEHWKAKEYGDEATVFFLEVFTRTFAAHKEKRIALYGAGTKAEMLLTNLADWHFSCLLDEAMKKQGKFLGGCRIVPKEALCGQADMIIVTARLCYFDEIAQRIRRDPLLNQYPVYYLDGRKIC